MFSRWRRVYPPLVTALLGFFLAFFLFRGPPPDVVTGALNATYMLDGFGLEMTDGQSFYSTSGGANGGVVTYIDRMPVRGLFPDGVEGAAVVLVQLSAARDIQYFLAATVKKGGRVTGTNAVLIEDRIMVLGVEVLDEMIWVHYLAYEDGQQDTEMPARQMTQQFIYRDGRIVSLS